MKRTPTDIPKASKEVILSAANLSNAAARFLVSDYYAAQEARKRADMQVRHLGEQTANELVAILQWSANVHALMEQNVLRMLQKFAESSAVGRWCLAQHGVGPVLAAGFIAHIDIEVAPTVGHIWSYAGLEPNKKWERGEKRPWNAELKQLTFHFGECAKRVSSHPDAFYGYFYQERKALLVARNEAGHNAERAKTFYTKSAEVRKTLATGKLPAGNLDRQACNITAKMFLSHLHAVMYWDHYGKPPPKPFAIAVLGHAHEVKVPHADMFPGFEEAYYGGGRQQAAE